MRGKNRMEVGKVSCIIASYNTKDEFLIEAVKSILQQTYSNLELIVVDDGSDIPVKFVLKEIKDERLIVLENKVNMGVTFSRNRALDRASGEFMAVMDADDVSDLTRFEKEVKYLNNHSECDLVSTQMAFLAKDGRKNPSLSVPKNVDKFLTRLFWDNSKPFPHGPAMIRMSFLKNNNVKYNERYKKALDYRLWVDCARKKGNFHIINEYLYYYRVHEGQISQKSRSDQIFYADMICLDQLEYLGIVPTEDEKKIHLYLRDSECWNVPDETLKWKNRLIQANHEKHYCLDRMFTNEVNYRYFKMCVKEYLGRKNKNFRRYFWKAMTIGTLIRSIVAVLNNRVSKKHPKTLKV